MKIVRADHPSFCRIDKRCQDWEIEPLKHELKLAGYENIKVEDFPNHSTKNK